MIQRFGPLRLSFACVAGGALGLAVFAEAGIAGLLVGAVLIGLCYGPLTPASSQAIAHQAGSPAFVLIVSIRQTSVPLGGVLAGLLVPPLLARLDWSGTCVTLAVGSVLAALAFAAASPLVRSERAAGGPGHRAHGRGAPLGRRASSGCHGGGCGRGVDGVAGGVSGRWRCAAASTP